MPGWRIGIWVVVVFAAIWFLYLVRGILLPFLVGWIVAIMLEPAVRRLQLMGVKRFWSIVILSTLFFGVATLFVVRLAPEIASQVSGVRDAVSRLTVGLSQGDAQNNVYTSWNPDVKASPPGVFAPIDQLMVQFGPTLEKFGVPGNRQALVDQYIEPQRENIARAVQSFFNGFFGMLAGAAQQVLLLAIVPLIVFYLLMDMDQLRRRSLLWIPPSIRASTIGVLQEVGGVFKNYLRGISIMIALYTSVTALWLGVTGVPYFWLIAVFAGLLYLIPIFGWAISALIIFFTAAFSGQTGPGWFHMSSNWLYAGIVVGVFALLSNVLFDQLLAPNIVGKAVDLHPLMSMFVITAAGVLFGIPGMIVAFPIAGSIKAILERLLRVASQPQPELAGLPSVPLRHRTNL